MASSQVLSTWLNASAVCFDVDSTVLCEEGIDVLAQHCGAGKAVAEWTAKAMEGDVTFQDALAARLALMKPSLSDINSCLSDNPLNMTAGITELVRLLHYRGTHVYLVSGGFRQMIYPIATVLGIPHDNVFANNLLFDRDGFYMGFDINEPTSKNGGKPCVIQQLKGRHGHPVLVMIGDGVTDMEARPPADLFIGFGGNIVRERVKQGADWFVYDFHTLIEPLRTATGSSNDV